MADVPSLPTAGEIKRMREYVRYYKWLNLAIWFMVLVQLVSAGAKFVALQRLCARTGISLLQVGDLGWVRDLDVNGIYPGGRILTASLMEDILMYLCFVLVYVAFWAFFRQLRKRNMALLYYIDREKKGDTGI